MDAKQHHGGDGLKDLDRDSANAILTVGDGEDSGGGAADDQEGGTTGAASMTGGDNQGARSPDAQGGDNSLSPGGRRESSAADELGEIGMSSAQPGPIGPGGGNASEGSGGGSHATGTYDQSGILTGPDSPGASTSGGAGQGDDLANRLGGGEGSGAGGSGGGAVSGDRSAGRSEGGGGASGYTPGAGDPGGMGGVNGTGKAPGGVSPIQKDED